jgi:hypothetical protein
MSAIRTWQADRIVGGQARSRPRHREVRGRHRRRCAPLFRMLVRLVDSALLAMGRAARWLPAGSLWWPGNGALAAIRDGRRGGRPRRAGYAEHAGGYRLPQRPRAGKLLMTRAGLPRHADVAQWQSPSLPSWSCGFDSRHPLQFRSTFHPCFLSKNARFTCSVPDQRGADSIELALGACRRMADGGAVSRLQRRW